jgi:two-component system, NtrC family, C4-dicarboxylate transport response regulator DctD
MLDVVLSSPCPEVRSRMSAACALLQANLIYIELDRLRDAKLPKDAWFLLDHDLDALRAVIPVLEAKRVKTERRLIRITHEVWQNYTYHDMPVFASLVKPTDALAASEVLIRLIKAKPFETFEDTNKPPKANDPFSVELTQSSSMKKMVSQLSSLINLPVDTILLGPTGAGKDTAARWLHDHSGCKGQFVHLNCAALPEQLFEAELFGVRAGAYTGATESRPGRMLQADKGTLYLDEIDSLALTSQAKLLTALQYRGATPLGGTEAFTSDFRLIVSTKTDFLELVKKGLFREDLYYRLNLSQIKIPALSERKEDIIPLYLHFLTEAARSMKREIPEMCFSEEAQLIAMPWPGNVRELRAHAFRRVIGLVSDAAEQQDLSEFDLKQAVNDYEKALLERCLARHSGNVKACAKQLGLQPQSLYYRMKTLGVNKGMLD